MHGRSRINLKIKLKLAQLLHLRVAFRTLPLFYLRAQNLRACARKNYATVETNPY